MCATFQSVPAYWELPLFRGRHDFLGAVAGSDRLGGSVWTKHYGFRLLLMVAATPSADRNGDSYCRTCPLVTKEADFRFRASSNGTDLPQSNEQLCGWNSIRQPEALAAACRTSLADRAIRRLICPSARISTFRNAPARRGCKARASAPLL